jgi:hypothetical protein
MKTVTPIKNQLTTEIYQNYVIESNDFLDLVHNLSQFSVIFPISQEKIDSTIQLLEPFFNAEAGLSIKLFIFNQELNFICLDAIAENLLTEFKKCTSVIFINRQNLIEKYFNQSNLLWKQLDSLGYKIFLNSSLSLANTSPQNYSLIDIFEFAVSSNERLINFPSISSDWSWLQNSFPRREKTPNFIFILDLIQDFEILIPIIQTISYQFQNLKIKVLFTKRFSSFPVTEAYLSSLDLLNILYYPVNQPYELIPFTDNNDVLFTASESSAPGHSFSYTVCKILGSSVLKITIQHGFENIGLNHHKAHDLQFPDGVRFASDFIFTWHNPEAYNNIHPCEFNKCIPVGIIKSIANDSCQYRSHFQQKKLDNSLNFAQTKDHKFKLLLAENLHSVRFKDYTPVYRYLEFIAYLNDSPDIELTVRGHPGKRWLEVNKVFEGINFYHDVLSIARLSYFEGIISPPSTFILDAILCNIPVSIWTIDNFGIDTVNYPSLPLVHNVNSFLEFRSRCSDSLSDTLYNQLSFLAKNTVSFNGTPYLISSVLSLL